MSWVGNAIKNHMNPDYLHERIRELQLTLEAKEKQIIKQETALRKIMEYEETNLEGHESVTFELAREALGISKEEYWKTLKYECNECGEIYETTDQDLIYCVSDQCVDKDIKLSRLHEL